MTSPLDEFVERLDGEVVERDVRQRMSLDRLWAGWRATYIEDVALKSPSDDGCLFERLLDADDDEALVLARAEHAFAVMNVYPYTSGHLMVAPTRHVAGFAELSRDEADALIAMTQDATVALERAYAPGRAQRRR